MAMYILLSRIAPGSFEEPGDFKDIAADVADEIRNECPGLIWHHSYATFGRYDAIDIIEADDPALVARAAMIIRSHGHATTETLVATPWGEFVQAL